MKMNATIEYAAALPSGSMTPWKFCSVVLEGELAALYCRLERFRADANAEPRLQPPLAEARRRLLAERGRYYIDGDDLVPAARCPLTVRYLWPEDMEAWRKSRVDENEGVFALELILRDRDWPAAREYCRWLMRQQRLPRPQVIGWLRTAAGNLGIGARKQN